MAAQLTKEEIAEAIKVHEVALTQAIRDAGRTWAEGRILMLIQTINALKAIGGK